MSKRNLVKTHKKRIGKLVKTGNSLEAKKLYFEICSLTPNDAQAWYQAGEFSEQLGHKKDAGHAYHRAAALDPNLDSAYLKLAGCQADLGFYDNAVQSLHSHLLLKPDSIEGLHQYAKLLAKLGRFDESHDNYLKALNITPGDITLLMGLGELYEKQARYDEALKHYNEAKTRQPDNATPYLKLGLLYRDTGDADNALENFRQFQQLAPNAAGAYEFYAATVAEEQGNFGEANALFEKSIAINPDSAKIHTAYALNLLRLGNWQKGWAEHEWRLRRADWLQQPGHRPIAHIPVWSGESLDNKIVLVNAEQGFGDALQFCRYLPQLAKQCDKLIVYCRPPLYRTLSTVEGITEVISQAEKLTARRIDTCIHMMSLPYIVATLGDNTEPTVPYFAAPAPSAELKQAMDFDGLKIGLVWRGNPSHPKNNVRSLRMEQLAPLAKTDNTRFYSLQKPTTNELREAPPEGMDLIDLDKHISDFHDVAAAIDMLDLVICVDTAIAHLAGALGKPVWTLLYFPSDWRWQVEGSDTAWYPSMRLFRQDSSKQWTPVIEEMANELKRLTK